jgi:pimeloyl-ACP methyl ester carboxylesterase
MSKRSLMVFALSIALALLISAVTFAQSDTEAVQTGYADVNGLSMYYEIHGTGEPLVVLHGAYMSILTMGEIIPRFAETRQVIAVELQGHGRTADIADRPFSYEQLADDVAALMAEIGVEKADVFGYSMGGGVALQVALRHPEIVDKLVVVSMPYSSDGYHPGFFDMVEMITPELFSGTVVETGYQSLAPNPENFAALVEKLVALDSQVFDWSAGDIQAITAPTLIIAGDSDAITPEHLVEMFRLQGGGVDGDLSGLPNGQLAILPGTSHIGVMFRVDWVTMMVDEFLDTPTPE